MTPFNVSIVSVSIASTLAPGDDIYPAVSVRNTGTTAVSVGVAWDDALAHVVAAFPFAEGGGICQRSGGVERHQGTGDFDHVTSFAVWGVGPAEGRRGSAGPGRPSHCRICTAAAGKNQGLVLL